MATTGQNDRAVFRVLDSMDAPHGGRILKLRFESGETPTTREISDATLLLTSPDGDESCIVRVKGFAVFGGRPSNDRLRRTGRVDVHVTEVEGDSVAVGATWQASELIP
ncbi:MAG: hypothetical protein VYD78_05760 [Gemmatimonadota bacterium]|jgi:hypothetical protein|uniref:Uncharacterized protein n=1 Tax=marine metagenome TaxID=408172 RepID=A0A382L7Q0_9ZZZZ|nr:hypothetical protein [Gemmatimonadota bacterium]